MNLVLDAGNTYVKAGIFINGRLKDIRVIPSAEFTRSMDIVLWAESVAGRKPDAVILSSVADPGLFPEAALGRDFFFIKTNHNTPLPVKNAYKTPETLGFDRIAAAAGAVFLFPGEDILAIDAGTCITYELIDRNKVYYGGAISPGIGIRYRSLHTMTSRLPLLENEGKVILTGQTTGESIHSGVLFGILLEVEGIISAYREKFPDIKTLITGGDMKYFEKNLKSNIFATPNLVLIGLNYILDYNAGKI
ncbi:MAG: type III pantothenate kinase [Bacteroidales bacterium]|nr:type III pantothenate kinase [Bacteroidales bacterium]